MSNFNDIEERLFMLLETIEKQAEQNAQLYEDAKQRNEQTEKREQHITKLEESQLRKLDNVYKQMIENIGVIESRTLKVQAGVIPAVRDEVQNTVTTVASELLNRHIGDNVTKYDSQIQTTADKITESADKIVESANGIINSANKAKNTLDETAENYKEWFAWKILAIWGGGILIVFCFLVALYVFMFPSLAEIKERRAELASIQTEIDKRGITASNCDGDTCVRVDTSTCNFGVSKFNSDVRYCKIN